MSDAVQTSAQSKTVDVPVEIVPVPSATDVAIDAWFIETFHNIGLDVQLFNRFRRAADALKERLRSAKE